MGPGCQGRDPSYHQHQGGSPPTSGEGAGGPGSQQPTVQEPLPLPVALWAPCPLALLLGVPSQLSKETVGGGGVQI